MHPVWEYFVSEKTIGDNESSIDWSRCRIPECSYKVKGKYTTTLRNHIQSKHKQHSAELCNKMNDWSAPNLPKRWKSLPTHSKSDTTSESEDAPKGNLDKFIKKKHVAPTQQMNRNGKHPVWKYFDPNIMDENGTFWSKCLLEPCLYKVKGRFSSTLKNHIKYKHKRVAIELNQMLRTWAAPNMKKYISPKMISANVAADSEGLEHDQALAPKTENFEVHAVSESNDEVILSIEDNELESEVQSNPISYWPINGFSGIDTFEQDRMSQSPSNEDADPTLAKTDVPCPLCSAAVAPASLESHLRCELAYFAWRCGRCAVAFATFADAKAHYSDAFSPHRGKAELIVEAIDPAKTARLQELYEAALGPAALEERTTND